jgi:hypothetical protein
MTQNVRQIKMENKNLPVIFLLILIFFNFSLIIGSASSSSPPDAYLIEGVQWHKQINDVFCGPAALEMVFDYWGANINQTEIANVARTSLNGTYTWDMGRAGHFSKLSASMGDYSPDNAPTSGFSERKLGYASFNYSSDTFWWPELKALVASDIPVVLLMKWAPDKAAGGHYRVIVGYDENKSDINKSFVYFMDPWGNKKITKEGGTITWNMTDFENAWNYSEYGTPHPYWGAIMMPWSVVLKTEGMTSKSSKLKVTANITYPCPKPFDCDAYPASATNATIIISSGMHLEGRSQPQITIGSLRAGESANVWWNVKLDADRGSLIKVKAEGLVSGEVPKIKKKGFVLYPSYEYTDNIGGKAKINI